VTSTKVIKWAASYSRLDHISSQASKHVLHNFVQDWLGLRECSGKIEETFSACFLSKPLWSLFSNSNWKHNNSLLACFPRDSNSINRRWHWRRKTRVWNTKHLSLSKKKLSISSTSLSTITKQTPKSFTIFIIFISFIWEHLFEFVFVQVSFVWDITI